MKKIIALILCLIMLFSLVACDDGDADATTTTTTTTTTTNTTTTIAPALSAGADEDKLVYADWDKDGFHIYVSNSGFDYNDGLTPETAVQTVYRANEIATDYINGAGTDKQDVIISLEAGNYFLPEAVRPVSGTDDIGVYFTSRGGRAYFTGGLNFKSYEIEKCTDSAILNKIFDETARESIYEIDLSYYSDYLTELMYVAGLKNDYGTYTYDMVEFFAGNYNLKPSRFPEPDYQVSENTAIDINMPGAFAIPYINYMKDGKFVTIEEIGADFATTPVNIFLRGDTYERVKSWDVANEKIYIEDTLHNNYTVDRHYVTSFTDARYSFNGGISYFDGYVTLHTGRGGNGAVGSLSDGGSASEFRRAYFFNIIEEINDPGEYYYDEAGKKLYVYLDETMPLDELYISTTTDHLFEIQGTESDLIKNINFVNVGFKYSQTHLIRIQNADGVTMSGCTVGLNAGCAVYTQNAINLTFKDSLFEATGAGVFWLTKSAWGDNDNDGVFDLANVLVENCVIRDISEQKVDYQPAFKMSNFSGLTVRRCTVSDGGHAAVNYGTAGNFLFEYNEWFDFMTETDDGGLSYSGMADATTMMGIVWRYNLIHDIGSTWQPWCPRVFYSDADSSLYTIHDNIIYNFCKGGLGRGLVFHNVHGANIYNNIVMDTGADVEILTEYLYEDQFTDLMRSLRSDTVRDGYTGTFYYQKFEGASGEDTLGFTDARDKLYNESGLLDEDFAFTFNRINYMRSDDFMYEIFSKGYAALSTGSGGSGIANISNKSIHNGGTVAVDADSISDFQIRLAQNVAGKAAGYYTFNSVDEMTRFMLSVGYKGDYDMSKLPVGVSMLYNGERVNTFCFNLIADNSPKEVANWVLSDIAKSKQATDATITNNIETLFSTQRGYAHLIYKHAIFSKVAYTGQYYNNLTINVANDMSTELAMGNKTVYWDSMFTKHWASSDYDGLDLEVLDENGEYTTDFIDTVTDILYNDENLLKDNDGEPVLQILDLSKVGARLNLN